jgi:hypothetical protein
LWHVTHATLYVVLSQFAFVRTSASPDDGTFPDVYVVWQFPQICVSASPTPVPTEGEVRNVGWPLACVVARLNPYAVWQPVPSEHVPDDVNCVDGGPYAATRCAGWFPCGIPVPAVWHEPHDAVGVLSHCG